MNAPSVPVQIDPYRAFLETKVRMATSDGFDVDAGDLHPWLKPHCRDIVQWALRGGRRAIFARFGLHKTAMQIEIMRHVARRAGGPTLIVTPLGVRQEFMRDGATMGVEQQFIRRASEMRAGVEHYLTNYESIRDGRLDPNLFAAASLDEASVLRSYGSKTYQEFLPLFGRLPYRFVATATPSPNRTKELIHYAGFLGVMDTGQALTRFFQRDSEKAGNLTLYPHMEEEFWLWVHSWACFIQKPSDLGHSDEGYDLPPLVVRWHEVPSDHSTAGEDRDGQGLMFRNAALGVTQAAAEKRDSIATRVAKMSDLIAQDPESHRLLWHDLESEREAIEKAVPGALSVYGALDLDVRERRIIDFSDGRFKYLATKPELSGSGCNFQRHCHKHVFVGVGFKFNDFIQAIHRTNRYGAMAPTELDIIHTEAEREVVASLKEKWAEYEATMARMSEIIRRYGLNHLPMADALKRTIGVERREARGDQFIIANNDCVDEVRRIPESSIGLIVTSIPFANHYEYTSKYNDFGHTEDNAQFWAQMDFLTPELLRILRPGRIAAIHVKDRILFGSATGFGLPTVSPFHAEGIFHYMRHGFDYLGMITVDTDVVRENNQTYRLGYSEMLKDGSRMGVGSPEYVLLFHKPQSDRSRGAADDPIRKDRDDYSLARWQLDAHAHWQSSGNRLLTAEELTMLAPNALPKAFAEWARARVYDHEAVVALGDALGATDHLPKTYMALAPISRSPWVWTDVVRMRTLNGEQSARNLEKHVCPLQFDIVDRLIDRYSMKGETVFDPFGGIMTVPYRAILKGRKGRASELHTAYFRDGLRYCEAAETKMATPALFDLGLPEMPDEAA